jgi:7-cyano-7-deazaguanine synthase
MPLIKAVIIFSGGLDSTVLCYKAVSDNFDVNAITILYGQRHSREVEGAKKTAGILGINHRVIDLSNINELLQGSALTDSNIGVPEVPETTEHFETLKSTIVPNRNAIFLSLAIGYSESIKANHIFFGAHHSDRGVYPDCRKEFVEAFEIAERLANDNPELSISAPFVEMDKSEIVTLGKKLGVPFEHTWTCYVGGELHCGVCSACSERKRAFREAGVTDPTIYEN